MADGETEYVPQGGGDLAPLDAASVVTSLALREAEHQYERALADGNPVLKNMARDALREALGADHLARCAYVDARRRLRPTLEELLREPTTQPDPDGVVVRAVLGGRVCMETLPVVSATAGLSAAPDATYLCLRSLPCPVHSESYQDGAP